MLTVLVPCFNEAGILQETVAQLTTYLDAGSWRKGLSAEGDWEILLVDDGSTDGSRTLLAELTRSDDRVRCLSYRTNAGQGQALQKGFAAAHGDWIFCVDADLDYGPEHIERFLALAEESGAEIVLGSPYMSGGMTSGVPLTRLCMSRLMNWYFRKVLNLGFSTYTSILRLYRREMIQALLLTSRDKELLPEIVIKASLLGIAIIEAPAHLRWKAPHPDRRRSGAGVLTTARKAVRHLLWGAMENPMLFFLGPALVVGAGALAYTTIKVLFGLGELHPLGGEADLIFTYGRDHKLLMFEDILSSFITFFFTTITTYLPPELFSFSLSLWKYGPEKIVALQEGYHAQAAHLTRYNHLFLWRYYAGFALALFLMAYWKVVKTFFKQGNVYHLVLFVLMTSTLIGSPTHLIIKWRPMHAAPLLGYQVYLSVIGWTLLLCYVVGR